MRNILCIKTSSTEGRWPSVYLNINKEGDFWENTAEDDNALWKEASSLCLYDLEKLLYHEQQQLRVGDIHMQVINLAVAKGWYTYTLPLTELNYTKYSETNGQDDIITKEVDNNRDNKISTTIGQVLFDRIVAYNIKVAPKTSENFYF